MFKIKRSLADKLFSDLIRMKAKYRCERCYRQYEKGDRRLHLSHYWSRGNRSVRFDEENVASLDFSCHEYFTKNPGDHHLFFMKRLGRDRYDLLEMRAKTPMKVDEGLLVIGFKKQLKELLKKEKDKIIGSR